MTEEQLHRLMVFIAPLVRATDRPTGENTHYHTNKQIEEQKKRAEVEASKRG